MYKSTESYCYAFFPFMPVTFDFVTFCAVCTNFGILQKGNGTKFSILEFMVMMILLKDTYIYKINSYIFFLLYLNRLLVSFCLKFVLYVLYSLVFRLLHPVGPVPTPGGVSTYWLG